MSIDYPATAEGSETKADPHLRRVTVLLASVANEKFDFDRAAPIAYRSRTTLIARTGK